jgi:hypothetical protein
MERTDKMRIIYAEYNMYHNSIDIATYAGYIVNNFFIKKKPPCIYSFTAYKETLSFKSQKSVKLKELFLQQRYDKYSV